MLLGSENAAMPPATTSATATSAAAREWRRAVAATFICRPPAARASAGASRPSRRAGFSMRDGRAVGQAGLPVDDDLLAGFHAFDGSRRARRRRCPSDDGAALRPCRPRPRRPPSPRLRARSPRRERGRRWRVPRRRSRPAPAFRPPAVGVDEAQAHRRRGRSRLDGRRPRHDLERQRRRVGRARSRAPVAPMTMLDTSAIGDRRVHLKPRGSMTRRTGSLDGGLDEVAGIVKALRDHAVEGRARRSARLAASARRCGRPAPAPAPPARRPPRARHPRLPCAPPRRARTDPSARA